MKIRTSTLRTLTLGATLGALTLGAVGTPQAQAKDIVATAQSTGMFDTLLAAAKAAGLAPMLMNDKSLTVFAPTDDAFAKLPAGTVENLLKPENKETLKKILGYHVLIGKYPAAKVMKLPSGTNVKTAEGEKIILRLSNGVMIDPGVGAKATVIKPNVMADNGIIHVIDTVLIPPSVQRMMAQQAKMGDMMDKPADAMDDGTM